MVWWIALIVGVALAGGIGLVVGIFGTTELIVNRGRFEWKGRSYRLQMMRLRDTSTGGIMDIEDDPLKASVKRMFAEGALDGEIARVIRRNKLRNMA